MIDNGYDPDISPDGTKLVFTRANGAGADLFEANIDGSGVTQLTFDASVAKLNRDPVWSPAGTRIAFQSSAESDILDLAAGTRTTWQTGTGRPVWQPVNPDAPEAPGSAPYALLKVTVGIVDPVTDEALVTLDATGTTGEGVSSYTFDFGDGAGPQSSQTPVVSKLEKFGSSATTTSRFRSRTAGAGPVPPRIWPGWPWCR